MKFNHLVFTSILLFTQIFGQQSVNLFAQLDATIDETTLTQIIPNSGDFHELVIPVGFTDRANGWPILKSSSYYPKHGVFPNGDLLSDSISFYNNAYPIENWYKPMLDDYFDTHSNGLHTVDFNFIKQSDGKPYTPDSSMAYWIVESGADTNIICNPHNSTNDITVGILSQVAENMYADNQNIFNNIDALHFVFNVGETSSREFNTQYGGTIGESITLESNGITYFEGSFTINWKADAIPHERLHLMGLPDRGTNKMGMQQYDIMDNRGVILSERSLYAQRPIKSTDLISFGWVSSDEILNVDLNNYQNFGEIKLADINYSLSSVQKSQGYYRFVKVNIPSTSQYFLIEYHCATEYDKTFSNIDEFSTNGYNKGVLIWHNWDIEIAVPYNGWEDRIPIPNDNYPRDDYIRDSEYLSLINEGDFDWLNDIETTDINGVMIFEHMPDGGRNNWDTCAYKDTSNLFSWDPSGERWLPRANSKRSDFFTDEVIQGYKVNKMTDVTRPSTKKRGRIEGRVWDDEIGEYIDHVYPAEKTHIGIVDMERKNASGYDYMTVKVFFNYWEGDITENTTFTGDVRIGGDLTIASNKTLTIEEGTNIIFENNSSLIVNGVLEVEGSSSDKVIFDFVAENSTAQNGIKINNGASANIDYAIIKNAYRGIYVNEDLVLTNSEIDSCRYGLYQYNSDAVIVSNSNIHHNRNGAYLYNSDGNFSDNLFTNNVFSGVECVVNSAPNFAPGDYPIESTGYNEFNSNDVGIISNHSYPELGRVSCTNLGGNNSFTNSDIVEMEVMNYSTIYAEDNYWGVSTPNSNLFLVGSNSNLYYNPYLTSPPSSSSTIKINPEEEEFNKKFTQQVASSVNSTEPMSLISTNTEDKSGYDESWPIEWKLLYARNLIRVNEYILAADICESVITTFPDSARSHYALHLFHDALLKGKNIDSYKKFVNEKVKLKTTKQLFGYAELLLAIDETDSKIIVLENLKEKYIDTPIVENILFDKFIYYLNEEINIKQAGLVSEKLREMYPNSKAYISSQRHLGNAVEIPLEPQLTKNAVNEEVVEIPKSYELRGNYPNPFNPSTTISYALPYSSNVELTVYDITGKVVKVFNENGQSAGYQNIVWNGNNQHGSRVSSGVYFYRFRATSTSLSNHSGEVFEKTAKMLLIK